MSLRRHSNWQHQLGQFLSRHETAVFAYSRLDCCLFVANAIWAITGTDIAEPFRGKYATRKEAVQLINAFTGQQTVLSIARKVAEQHGMKEVLPAFAQRGDMVVLKRPGDYSLAIVGLDGKTLYALAKLGLATRPVTEAYTAFRV